jgi:hypothetical protein
MPDVQRADRVARRRALIVLAVMACCGAIAIILTSKWLEALESRPTVEASRAMANALVWVGASLACLLAAFAVYAWRLGGRIKRSCRFPPPGDTPVWDGARAHARGVILQVLAASLIVAAVALVVCAVAVASQLARTAA